MRALVDRCFDDPDGGVVNSAAVLNLLSGEIETHVGPMISSVTSPVFDATGARLVLIHTDQGGARVCSCAGASCRPTGS